MTTPLDLIAEARRLTRAYARLMTPDDPTHDSIARARATQLAERHAVTQQTGLVIGEDDRVRQRSTRT